MEWEAPYPDGISDSRRVEESASSPGRGDRPRGDAKRTGSVSAVKPRRSIEDRSCLGMELTTVSAHAA